jgi:hypothetical protein
MNKREQIRFTRDLVRSVTRTMTDQIRKGKIPQDWDGLELRELLKDKFAEQSVKMHLDRSFKTRYKEYKNHVLVNYLT